MATAVKIETDVLQELMEALQDLGYTIIGPRQKAAAMVLGPIASIQELPWGWRDRQAPGAYSAAKSAPSGFFQYTCGPDTWKRFLYPPRSRLFHATMAKGAITLAHDDQSPPRYAFLGMRACDLKALAILDRVFLKQDHPDPHYQTVRQNLFIIAVNCLEPGDTCFCAAMGAGPRADSGFDLVLTEICTSQKHELLVASGSPQGAALLATLPSKAASAETLAQVARGINMATEKMARRTPLLSRAADIFASRFNDSHWASLQQRCLACGNCTLVCPTCFCHTIEEREFLETGQAERHRVWDSCFSRNFSYMHGGSARASIASRYRQWLCHKLSTWQPQFGTLGCVGCGRCRTWCPAGIDMVEEARALISDAADRAA